MPPGPAYNWLCVLHSCSEIVYNAAHIRAEQLAPRSAQRLAAGVRRAAGQPRPVETQEFPEDYTPYGSADSGLKSKATIEIESERLPSTWRAQPSWQRSAGIIQPDISPPRGLPEQASILDSQNSSLSLSNAEISLGNDAPAPLSSLPASKPQPATVELAPVVEPPLVAHVEESISSPKRPDVEYQSQILPDSSYSEPSSEVDVSDSVPQPTAPRVLKASKVPSSRLGRLFHYGGLAASLGYGAASEVLRRTTSSSPDASGTPIMLTEANVSRLVNKLTEMRGAALKLGQFLSIQDSHLLPPQVEEVFRRVQDGAHYMPDWQMEQVMTAALGADWATRFASFERIPFAAASIGQVHAGVLAAAYSPTGRDEKVAIKIQFPNVADSIGSDLSYARALLTAGRVLPKGLFLERTIEVMKEELADECNYSREASFARRFGTPECLGADPRFKVPWVWEGSTERVLVMEHLNGHSIGKSANSLSQADRDDIAERILELCLRELFDFRVMQTDPNWSNFLWNPKTRQIELVDFGATREYSKEFIDNWLRLLQAAITDDHNACIKWSRKLGYLTGEEHEEMNSAHVKSMQLLGTPFRVSTHQPYTFGPGTEWAQITQDIRALIPVMLQHRLTPPPRETYSLNRKLSGAFLLASRLGARVDCRAVWDRVVDGYEFDPEP